MRLHSSGLKPGRLQFEIGNITWGKGEDRKTERHWVSHRIKKGWGISFGARLFIGILAFDETGEVRERIKEPHQAG